MNNLKGTYKIKMVLPAWTVENEITLAPEEGGRLLGKLNTMDDNPPISFSKGYWNKEYFKICLQVGPGQLELTGKVTDGKLEGVVVIEDTPDSLTGTKIEGED